MSNDVNQIIQKMLLNQEELIEKVISKDVTYIKEEIQNINNKIEIIIDILNNFTIMLAEEADLLDDEEEDDNPWASEDGSWISYGDDDEEDEGF